MGYRAVVQIASIIVASLGIIGWLRWAKLSPRVVAIFAFAPIWYLAQLIAFYLSVFYFSPHGERSVLFTDLSAILRLEGAVLLAGSAFIMTYFLIRKDRKPAQWNGPKSPSHS